MDSAQPEEADGDWSQWRRIQVTRVEGPAVVGWWLLQEWWGHTKGQLSTLEEGLASQCELTDTFDLAVNIAVLLLLLCLCMCVLCCLLYA